MMNRNQSYYSKLLLFGEYSILLGSSALSVPYSHFQAELSFIREDKYTDLNQAEESNQMLRELFAYLKTGWVQAGEILDLELLGKDLDDGLYLESGIPQSYGLGSSGAVCASLYGKYAFTPIPASGGISPEEISSLRTVFSQMESFFHGKSSGIDPLGIYLRYPLHIPDNGKPELVGIPRNWKNDASGIFLIDTGSAGKTNPLVNLFLHKFAPAGKISPMGTELVELNNSCIRSLLTGEIPDFWQYLERLSAFQFEHLRPMIPDKMRPLWSASLENKLFDLKICGSGGGGFLIGFAPDYRKAFAFLREQNIQTIPVYLAG